jgi:hypothetical protein
MARSRHHSRMARCKKRKLYRIDTLIDAHVWLRKADAKVIPDYLETLSRFGLQRLNSGEADSILDADGNIAATRDGNWQMGGTAVNAMFRLVDRWRVTDQATRALFLQTKDAESLASAMTGETAGLLTLEPKRYMETQERVAAVKEMAATFAGAVFVTLNNTLQRFREDIGIKASDAKWTSSGWLIQEYSIGEIASAASINFRHHDEWAATSAPNDQQLRSMRVLAKVLGCDATDQSGHPTVRTNVCDQMLASVCGGSPDLLAERMFEYCKAIAVF